jgi:hypothetical protein
LVFRSSPVHIRLDDKTVQTIGRVTYRLVGPTNQNPAHPVFSEGVPEHWRDWLLNRYMVQKIHFASSRAKTWSNGYIACFAFCPPAYCRHDNRHIGPCPRSPARCEFTPEDEVRIDEPHTEMRQFGE